MRNFFGSCLLSALIGLFAAPGYASDREREARLVAEIEANIFDGEVIRLDAEGVEFAGVEMAPTDEPRGAVILMHGRGFHADWPENIGPLRVALSEAGWHTLSLQLPVLEKTAKYFDYVPILPEALPRIDAAISHLKGQGIDRIVLLSHSCGAHMAMLWLEKKQRQRDRCLHRDWHGRHRLQAADATPFLVCFADDTRAGPIRRAGLPCCTSSCP